MTGAAPSLGGKIAVVTGASRGIGAATANVLASAGAAVVVNYLTSRERAEQVVIDIKRAGGEATAVGCDVTQPGEVASLERFTRETYGAADILVNNAGRANERKRFEELEWEDYQSQIDGTLKSTFHTTQAFLPQLLESGDGRVICIGSITPTNPTLGSHAYIAAKAGLVGLVRTLAIEVAGRGVTVNLVAPALVLTDRADRFSEDFKQEYAERTPLGRIAAPEDIADIVRFLATDASRYITGAVIDASGGLSILS